jgi:hypothetical protein
LPRIIARPGYRTDSEGDYSLQHFIAKLLKNHFIMSYEVEASERIQLEIWNFP